MKISAKSTQGGFTLIEVIVTLALYSIVIALIMGVLLPAVKFSARYSDKDSDTAFLSYAQELLTEKIRYAERIAIYDNSDANVNDDFARPVNGYYNIDHNLFKRKVNVDRGGGIIETMRIGSPNKPDKDTDLIIHVSKLGSSLNDLTVRLVLERNGKMASKAEFSVRALNAPVDFTGGVDEGSQAIYIE